MHIVTFYKEREEDDLNNRVLVRAGNVQPFTQLFHFNFLFRFFYTLPYILMVSTLFQHFITSTY